MEKLLNSLQLSATTLFYGVYGGIVPIGWSRLVAFFEGSVGFLLPALILIKYVPLEDGQLERSKLPKAERMMHALFVALGAFFVSLGLKIFLVPNHIIDGGIVGISIIISYLTDLKLELLLLILNLPFLYLGYKKIGKKFVLTTLLGIGILSFGTFFLYNVPVPTENLLLASVLGGTFLGIGVGVVIRYGGSLDGTEILGILLNQRISFSIGKIIMFINFFIFCSAGFIFSWDRALYSLIAYYIASKMMDVIIERF
ncbi:YitT family protein [Bacillus sp. PK3_68]|uniref:YitT family protein n=1 Tax=Bacillus sp. PK3_68 TaxID=2027408 RepID=UPI00217EAFD6|nr:YitT family protein [Bacillus sp. PK3_68]